ncbi:MAG: ABC transporter permease [Clostridia bacterium]|nr:ABC transporter permease [Clostridia bacterium]
MSTLTKKHFESPIHISKRNELVLWKRIVIKVVAGIVSLLICAIFTTFLGGDFGFFFEGLFKGAFGNSIKIVSLFKEVALLLIVSLAITPAFKMRFWNIGAEGQILFGAYLSTIIAKYCSVSMNKASVLILMLLAGIVGGGIWGLIPAVFKALWNTNETLFTLMLNYIAKGLILYTIALWLPNGQTALGTLPDNSVLPKIFGQDYIIIYIVSLILTAIVFVYLKYSKHGYELTVVGESLNTARYIGLNVKKVIIRTMVLSGAICGLCGFLIVSGDAQTLTDTVSAGRGFTAILISWLSGFNPIIMIVMSFLVGFIDRGASGITEVYMYRDTYADIISGIFFFGLIASNFFVNYKLSLSNKFASKLKKAFNIKEKSAEIDSSKEAIEEDKKPTIEENNEVQINAQSNVDEQEQIESEIVSEEVKEEEKHEEEKKIEDEEVIESKDKPIKVEDKALKINKKKTNNTQKKSDKEGK